MAEAKAEREPVEKKAPADPQEGAKHEAERFLTEMEKNANAARRDFGAVAFDERVLAQIREQAESHKKLQEVKIERSQDGSTTIQWKSGKREYSITAKGREAGKRNKEIDLTDGLQGAGKLSKEQNDRVDLLAKDKSKLTAEELKLIEEKTGKKDPKDIKGLDAKQLAKALYGVSDQDIRHAEIYQSQYQKYLKENGSVPVRRGEGYFDIAKRMNPRQDGQSQKDYDEMIKQHTKNLKDWNGGRTELREGEQLRTWPPEEDEKRIGPAARREIAESDFKSELKDKPETAKLPDASQLAGLTEAQRKEFQDKQEAARKADPKAKYGLADYLIDSGMDKARAEELAKSSFEKRDELARAQLDAIRGKTAESLIPADEPNRASEVLEKKSEIAEQEKQARSERSKAAIEKAFANPIQKPPLTGELAGVPPEIGARIKRSQDEGDPRFFGEIAKAWGVGENIDDALAKQKELKDLHNEATKYAADQNKDARLSLGRESESKFRENPKDSQLPSMSNLLGMTGKLAGEFDRQSKDLDEQKLKELAKGFGVPDEEFEAAQKKHEELSELKAAIQQSTPQERAEKARAVADAFTKNPQGNELPKLSELLGLPEKLGSAFERAVDQKDDNESKKIAERYGIGPEEFDAAKTRLKDLSSFKQELLNFKQEEPAAKAARASVAEDGFRRKVLNDHLVPTNLELAGVPLSIINRSAELRKLSGEARTRDQIVRDWLGSELPASVTDTKQRLMSIEQAVKGFKKDLNPASKPPSVETLAGLNESEIRQINEAVEKQQQNGVDGFDPKQAWRKEVLAKLTALEQQKGSSEPEKKAAAYLSYAENLYAELQKQVPAAVQDTAY